jgi:spoIIIJ-associated protein
MRSVEVTAKTREEAIENALQQLGAERHEVDVEILDEGSRGLFGFGARDVKVRVSAEHLPDLHEEKAPVESSVEEETREKGTRPGRKAKPIGRRSETSAGGRGEKVGRRQASAPAAEKEQTPASQQEDLPEAAPKTRTEPKHRERSDAPQKAPCDVDLEGRGNEAAALLGEVINRMGMEGAVGCDATEDGNIRLSVQSPDSAILIGRKGRTLEALQYLINRMLPHEESGEDTERIIVDVEGYLDRRKDSLEAMAYRMADKVRHSGRRLRLKPLNPQERRIIHLALQDDPDVRTFSVGENLLRSVVIVRKDEEKLPRKRDVQDGRGRRRRSRQESAPHSGGEAESASDAEDSLDAGEEMD